MRNKYWERIGFAAGSTLAWLMAIGYRAFDAPTWAYVLMFCFSFVWGLRDAKHYEHLRSE